MSFGFAGFYHQFAFFIYFHLWNSSEKSTEQYIICEIYPQQICPGKHSAHTGCIIMYFMIPVRNSRMPVYQKTVYFTSHILKTFFTRCSTSLQHIAFFTLQLFAFCSFCDTSPHQSASTTPCLLGNHSLQGSHNTPKASLLLHEMPSSYPSTAAKAAKAPAKTIELIYKQRVSRVIILHERCHPLVVCFMPHLHSFNNDWLFPHRRPYSTSSQWMKNGSTSFSCTNTYGKQQNHQPP